jgi:hypothetical protein
VLASHPGNAANGVGRDHERHERVEFSERLGRQDRKEGDVSSVNRDRGIQNLSSHA